MDFVEIIKSLMDFILHVDEHLFVMIQEYGLWVYILLFIVIFVETGLVVMPFLPGDSLLFAAGAFCAGVVNDAGVTAKLSLPIIIVSLTQSVKFIRMFLLDDLLTKTFFQTLNDPVRLIGFSIQLFRLPIFFCTPHIN